MAVKLQTDILKKDKIQVQKLPEVNFGNQGLDPANWATRVASSAKSKQAAAGPGLQVISPVDAVGLLKEALLSPAEKKFREARAVLAKARKADPDLHMASILDGLCCYRLKDDWTALECLLP